ncbi:MAG: preprotein translocase subunit SecE [Ornithinimicrobium sp.]|uniref:preprotein translocase subunit SecE n=1 Tax=Ornithinimicrobium sp. TaxID=1977084 RepID=UPI0026DEB929|nr:preprotein translocase subunit SecE [Ornithinimicrobium sp.]MDO5739440.1 preprotein translocase subunit SecE [Ornithinimicrobium sp.]
MANPAPDTEGVARSQAGSGQPPRPATFLAQVMAEMRKVVQPTRQELITYTVVVMLFVSVIMAFIFGVDQLSKALMDLIFGS